MKNNIKKQNETVDKMTKMMEKLTKKLCVAIQEEGFAIGVDIDNSEVIFRAIDENKSSTEFMDYDTFIGYFPFLFDICIKEILQEKLDDEKTGIIIKNTFENPILEVINKEEKAKLC